MVKRPKTLANVFSSLESSLQRLALNNAINRRRNTRILYPHIGAVGGLPRVVIQHRDVRTADISLGGLCLIDDTNEIGETVGQEIPIRLIWDDLEILQTGVVVGVNLDRRHIQFQKPHPEIFVRLNVLLKPGFIGSRMRKVPLASSIIQFEATELWLSATGESVLFHDENIDKNAPVDITLLESSTRVHRDTIPVYLDRGAQHLPGQRVTQRFLSDLIMMLANIKNPSHRILNLIETLPQYLEPTDRAT